LSDQIARPDVKSVIGIIVNNAISKEVYLTALNIYRPAVQQAYRDYFTNSKVDAVILPTVPLTARPIDGSLETVELDGQQAPTFATYIRNTDRESNADIPGLSIPPGLSSGGFPIGVYIEKLIASSACIDSAPGQADATCL